MVTSCPAATRSRASHCVMRSTPATPSGGKRWLTSITRMSASLRVCRRGADQVPGPREQRRQIDRQRIVIRSGPLADDLGGPPKQRLHPLMFQLIGLKITFLLEIFPIGAGE